MSARTAQLISDLDLGLPIARSRPPMVVVRTGPPPPSTLAIPRKVTLLGIGDDPKNPPLRPRPVTLVEGFDDVLAARYRAEASLLLAQMMASARPGEHPLLRFVRDLGRQLAHMVRVALA